MIPITAIDERNEGDPEQIRAAQRAREARLDRFSELERTQLKFLVGVLGSDLNSALGLRNIAPTIREWQLLAQPFAKWPTNLSDPNHVREVRSGLAHAMGIAEGLGHRFTEKAQQLAATGWAPPAERPDIDPQGNPFPKSVRTSL
jgi:hypothetical protein